MNNEKRIFTSGLDFNKFAGVRLSTHPGKFLFAELI